MHAEAGLCISECTCICAYYVTIGNHSHHLERMTCNHCYSDRTFFWRNGIGLLFYQFATAAAAGKRELGHQQGKLFHSICYCKIE